MEHLVFGEKLWHNKFNRNADRTVASLEAITKPSEWTTLTLLQGFTHADGYPVQCAKDSLGFVHFRGYMKAPASMAGNYVIILPDIYRPAISQFVAIPVFKGISLVSLMYAMISSGDAYMYIYPSVAVETTQDYWVGAITPYKARD